jgi:S1-C subfamily serine protease
LPERWRNLPSEFDLSTPVNLVSTNDITGGNSGSPLLNKDLEVVGLIFDGNIESLAGDYIYMPDRGMRSISVDVRGMIEALDVVYGADRLVREVTGQSFVPSEEAADAAASRTP